AHAHLGAEPRRLGHRSGAPDIVREQRVKLSPEPRVALRVVVDARELVERAHQGFGDVAAAVGAEATGGERARLRWQRNLQNAERAIAKPERGTRNAERIARPSPGRGCSPRPRWALR